MEVKHNGSLVSKLGDRESVSILGLIGDNIVSVNWTGVAAIGMNTPQKVVKLSESEKDFLPLCLKRVYLQTNFACMRLTRKISCKDELISVLG